MFLERYRNATDRQTKSQVVTEVLDILYGCCGNSPEAAFIRYKDGRWWSVNKQVAREKVGAYFRDSLSERYRSSAKAKITRRRARDRTRSRTSQSSNHQGSAKSLGTGADSCISSVASDGASSNKTSTSGTGSCKTI